MSINQTCPFCNVDRVKIIESDLSFAIYDAYPVNAGHALIISKRHVANYFDLLAAEQVDCFLLLDKVKMLVQEKFNPDGYNIGININQVAGQTVPHVHIHLIPRYHNDVENPLGGVRGVIPSKRQY